MLYGVSSVSHVDDVCKVEILVQWVRQKWKICHTTVNFISCALCFTTSTPLSLLSSCELSLPVVGLKIYCLPFFELKSGNWIFMWYIGECLNTCSFPHKIAYWVITVVPNCCRSIQLLIEMHNPTTTTIPCMNHCSLFVSLNSPFLVLRVCLLFIRRHSWVTNI